LARIENRLTDLGINGKINRLSFLKNISQVVGEEVKRGVKTIVVLGNDQTLGYMINIIADLDVVIGFIPIGQNHIASLLNIPIEEAACDVLSARIIKKLDLGKINNDYFLTSIRVGGKEMFLEFDDSFVLSLDNKENEMQISNLDNQPEKNINPDDGMLDVFIKNRCRNVLKRKSAGLSRFSGSKIKIARGQDTSVFLNDSKKMIKPPAIIKVLPHKIKMITGKGTHF